MNRLIRQTPRRPATLLLAVTLAVCGSGCLGFESQTLVLYFPKDGGEIQGLFVYENLLVSLDAGNRQPGKEAGRERDLKEAIKDLNEIVKGDAIIFGHRMFMAKLQHDPKDDPKILTQLKDSVKAHKGEFFLSADGKLSYCQPVTLRDPQKVAAALNKFFTDELSRRNFGGRLGELADDETRDLIDKFARDGKTWLKFDKGRISLTIPGSTPFFKKVREEIFADPVKILDKFEKDYEHLEASLKSLEKPGADVKAIVATLKGGLKQSYEQARGAKNILTFLAMTPISIDQHRQSVTFSLGYGDNESFQIVSPFTTVREGFPKLDEDLKAHAKTLGVPVRTDVALDAVISEFQRSGRLPKRK